MDSCNVLTVSIKEIFGFCGDIDMAYYIDHGILEREYNAIANYNDGSVILLASLNHHQIKARGFLLSKGFTQCREVVNPNSANKICLFFKLNNEQTKRTEVYDNVKNAFNPYVLQLTESKISCGINELIIGPKNDLKQEDLNKIISDDRSWSLKRRSSMIITTLLVSETVKIKTLMENGFEELGRINSPGGVIILFMRMKKELICGVIK